MVLIVAGKSSEESSDAWQSRALELLEAGHYGKEIAEEIAERYNVPKNEVKKFLVKNKAE